MEQREEGLPFTCKFSKHKDLHERLPKRAVSDQAWFQDLIILEPEILRKTNERPITWHGEKTSQWLPIRESFYVPLLSAKKWQLVSAVAVGRPELLFSQARAINAELKYTGSTPESVEFVDSYIRVSRGLLNLFAQH